MTMCRIICCTSDLLINSCHLLYLVPVFAFTRPSLLETSRSHPHVGIKDSHYDACSHKTIVSQQALIGVGKKGLIVFICHTKTKDFIPIIVPPSQHLQSLAG